MNMNKSLAVMAVCMFSFSVFSATYISNGNSGGNNGQWTNLNNWQNVTTNTAATSIPCEDPEQNDIVIITNNDVLKMNGGSYTCQSLTLTTPTANGKKNSLTIMGNATLVINGGDADTNDDIVNAFGDNGASLVISDKGTENTKVPELIINYGRVIVTESDVDSMGYIFVDQDHPHETALNILKGDLNLIGENAELKNTNPECGKVLVGDDFHLDGAASITTSPNNTYTGKIVPIIVGFNDIFNTDTGLRPNIDTAWTTFPGSTNFSYTDGNNGDPANVIGVENFFHTINQCQTALPVEFVFFQVEENNKKALLKWQTETESNNEGYFIETSEDGRVWETLDFVNAILKDENGNTLPQATTRNYSFTHDNPVINITNYYRLMQVDFDGAFDFSPVRTIKIVDESTNIDNVKVFPSIVTTSNPINVKGLNEDDIFDIKVTSFTGQVVYVQQGIRGAYEAEIPATYLNQSGYYAVTIYNRSLNIIATRKIVKQ